MKNTNVINKFDAIVACYNEEGRVGNVLKVLENSNYINHVIFVNDGSTDNSLNEAKKFKTVKIVNLKNNVGKGEAVKKGLKKVTTKAVFLFDADLFGLKEKHISRMYHAYLKNPNHLLVGLRQKNNIKLLHWLRLNILPLIGGERILSTKDLKAIVNNYDIEEWGLEAYMNYHFNKSKRPINKIFLEGVNDLPKYKKEDYGIQPFVEEAIKVSTKYFQIYSKEIPRNVYDNLSSFALPLIFGPQEKRNKLYANDIYTVKSLIVNKKKINYAQAGKGQFIVFVHGLANNWISWVPLASYLYKNYTVILIDLPGFGDSDNLEEYSIKNASIYLQKFIEKLPEKPIALIGQSMGSMVVSEACKNNQKFTDSVVLIGPVIKSSNLKKFATKTLESSLNIIDKFSMSEMFLKKIVDTRIAAYSTSKYINMHKFDKFLVDEYGMIGKKKMRKETFVQMGHSSALYNQKSALLNLQIPTLIIYGKEDKISSPADLQRTVLNKNKHIYLNTIPNAGHVVPLEQPEEVALKIKAFLSKN